MEILAVCLPNLLFGFSDKLFSCSVGRPENGHDVLMLQSSESIVSMEGTNENIYVHKTGNRISMTVIFAKHYTTCERNFVVNDQIHSDEVKLI